MADKRANYTYASVGEMPTEEEMNEYRRTKVRSEDPMAKYVDEDEAEKDADLEEKIEKRRRKKQRKKEKKEKRPKKKRKTEDSD